MEAKNTGAANRIVYEEFEPFCKWQREETRDTLVVHLPDFVKEELKVNINNRGILKVSGERSVDAGKKSKFIKEVPVPRNCNANAIQAKFANSHLYIIMPKNTSNPVIPEQNKPQQVADSNISTVDQKKKPEASQDQAAPPQQLGSKEENASRKSDTTDAAAEEGSTSRGQELANMVINVGMIMILMAAIMSFVVYMYKSTIVED